jgi:hypothetical protein
MLVDAGARILYLAAFLAFSSASAEADASSAHLSNALLPKPLTLFA